MVEVFQPSLSLLNLLSFIAPIGLSADDLQKRLDNEELICTKIFKDYNYDVSVNKLPVRMMPYFAVEHVGEIDEEHQTMTLNGVFILQWVDARLTWVPSDFGNIRRITRSKMVFNRQNLWTPSIHITDLASRTFNLLDNADSMEVTISFLGVIRVQVRMQIRTTCYFEIGSYPYDRQNCSFSLYTPYDAKEFEFSRYGGVELTKYDTIGQRPDVDLQDFQLDNIEGRGYFIYLGNILVSKIKDSERSLARSFFRYNLSFKRVNKYYSARMVVPVVCISMFLLVSTMIKGQKSIIWLLTCLLLQILNAIEILNGLPPDYNEMPMIGTVIVTLIFESVILIVWRTFSLFSSQYKSDLEEFPPLEQKPCIKVILDKTVQIGDTLIPILMFIQTLVILYLL